MTNTASQISCICIEEEKDSCMILFPLMPSFIMPEEQFVPDF